jgi:hypothetical protein
MVCLLGRCDVVLEIGGGMLPCLKALREELCNLMVVLAARSVLEASLLTSDVSSPGMASVSELLVNERVGSSLVADCGALMFAVYDYSSTEVRIVVNWRREGMRCI